MKAVLLAAAIAVSTSVNAQVDSMPRPPVLLDEFLVQQKAVKVLKHHVRTWNLISGWRFEPGHERYFREHDSSFNLTPVAALSAKPVRLREVSLRLPSWDTSRMRLNLMILQVRGADTFCRVRPIPMRVHGRWMRMRVDNIELEPYPFFIGYSFGAFHIPEPVYFRLFTKDCKLSRTATVRDGLLRFSDTTFAGGIIPFEVRYEEI